MIIKLSAFALVSVAMLCGTVPVSLAVGDSDSRSSQDELNVTRNHLQQAKQKIDELERQLAAGNLENAKRRIGELVIELHAKENEIAALRSSAHEISKNLREDLASQAEELNQAKRRVAEVEQQMAAGKGQDLTQAKRRTVEAEQQTARKEQELAQAKRRMAEVEQQMAGKDQELAQAKRRMAEAEQQMAGKDYELTQAKRRAVEAEQQTARKEQELAQAKRRMAEAEQQMVGKEQELAQAKRRAADAEQQTVRKEQELAQGKRRKTEVEQQPAAGKDQELAQAKRRAAEVEQQMEGKDQELTQAKRRATEVEQQMARKEQELAQVRDDFKQVTQKLADLNPQLMARDAELSRTKQLLSDLERNFSKPPEATPTQEESSPDKNSLPPQSVEENLSVTNLLPPAPAVADDAEAFLSSDLGKMNESLASLLQPELRKGNVTLRQRGNKLTLAFAIGELFTPGDATVTLGGTSLLERVGTVLHRFRYQSVEVAGHTDNTPVRNDSRRGFRDNIELSRTRAEHASQALLNGGLEADRVKAVGYADTKPIATNDTEKGRSKNRRMEIVITQWSELGGNSGDSKTQVGKKLRGFSTQSVTHH
ncbi:MAG: OmpA family protein [Nitrospira sp.]|nr:OmpA family protein [Nitrospira sp.]